MKNIYLICIFLLSNFTNSQKLTLNGGTIKEKDYFSEIKFEYVNGKIIIPVLINEITYRFLLDTGAPNLISKKLTDILNLKTLDEIQVSDANEKKSTMKVVEIPNLQIGDVIFEKSIALSNNGDNNFILDCFNIDGFIGSNMLRNSIIQIDINNKTLKITNGEKKLNLNKNNSIKLGLYGIQSLPFIWIKALGKNSAKEQVLLDTGMKGFYDLSIRNYNKLKDEKIFEIISKGTGTSSIGLFGNAEEQEQLNIILPKMKIGNSNFLNISTVTTNDENSKLGIDLFENGIGTIDYKNKKFYFDPIDDIKDLKEEQLGFDPTILNQKFSIGIVWDTILKTKIKSGDEIISVNGKLLENIPICDFIAKTSVLKNIKLKEMIVKNKDGQIIKVDF